MVTPPGSAGSRPAFHFTPRREWINDPHGITWRNGTYHVFYQYVPDHTAWAPQCNWGHATGSTLFALREGQPVLAPDQDDDGVWSGSVITDPEGRGRIFYPSVSVPDFSLGSVREATTNDPDWAAWDKGRIVVVPPEGLDLAVFRDPYVYRDQDRWRMLVGAGLRDGTAAALGYSSTDLTDWRYDGIVAQRPVDARDPVWTGAAWECPQLFEIDGRHVLITSVWDDDKLYYAAYGIGALHGDAFVAESWGQLTYGNSYYAPSFFRDRTGRPCLSLWMRGIADLDSGWASAHSIPYALALDGEALVARPHPDIERLRGPRRNSDHRSIGPLSDVNWEPADDTSRLRLLCGRRLVLEITRRPRELVVATSAGSTGMPYSDGEVRVVLDAGVVEISTRDGLLGFPVAAWERELTIDRVEGHLKTYDLHQLPPASREQI